MKVQVVRSGQCHCRYFRTVEDEFASLGLKRGTMRLVEIGEQRVLLDRYRNTSPSWPGRLGGDSVIAFSQLGGSVVFIGCVGDDRYGLLFKRI